MIFELRNSRDAWQTMLVERSNKLVIFSSVVPMMDHESERIYSNNMFPWSYEFILLTETLVKQISNDVSFGLYQYIGTSWKSIFYDTAREICLPRNHRR